MVGNNLVNLAAESKFRDSPVGYEALNELDDSIGRLRSKRFTRRMILSPSGFTDDLKDYAEENGILLIGLDMLLGKAPLPEL